jgi:hypothetical protein
VPHTTLIGTGTATLLHHHACTLVQETRLPEVEGAEDLEAAGGLPVEVRRHPALIAFAHAY